jgi:hypothetical protein
MVYYSTPSINPSIHPSINQLLRAEQLTHLVLFSCTLFCLLQDVTTEETDAVPATPTSSFRAGAETIVPLLIRFKFIRLVTRCFDCIVANRPRFGEEGAR